MPDEMVKRREKEASYIYKDEQHKKKEGGRDRIIKCEQLHL